MADGKGNKTFERWRFVQATALGRLMLPSLVAQASDRRQRSLYSCLDAWHSHISTCSLLATICFYFSSYNTGWHRHTFWIVTGRYLMILLLMQISWFSTAMFRSDCYLEKSSTKVQTSYLCSDLKARVWVSIVLSGPSRSPSFLRLL
jgi:predicted Na+-dependent transporter